MSDNYVELPDDVISSYRQEQNDLERSSTRDIERDRIQSHVHSAHLSVAALAEQYAPGLLRDAAEQASKPREKKEIATALLDYAGLRPSSGGSQGAFEGQNISAEVIKSAFEGLTRFVQGMEHNSGGIRSVSAEEADRQAGSMLERLRERAEEAEYGEKDE